jgi:CRP-like cAMP-binding protein
VGTRYYLVVEGRLDVTIEGRWVRSLGAGQSFGEIAILRDVPRTATVSAATAVELLAIERGDFLESVTGHPRSMGRATQVAERFLPS